MNTQSHVARSADDVPIQYEVHGNGTIALVFVHRWSRREKPASKNGLFAVNRPFLPILRIAYQRLLERLDDWRCCWKQSEQYTGLSPRGTNGTRASLPHDAQVALCISRSLRL
jgi:hypothetical protein